MGPESRSEPSPSSADCQYPLPALMGHALGSHTLGTDISARPELGAVPGAEVGRQDSKTRPCGGDTDR